MALHVLYKKLHIRHVIPSHTHLSPPLNSFIMVSLSFFGMSPCMDETVKFASRIFSVSHSTLEQVRENQANCIL